MKYLNCATIALAMVVFFSFQALASDHRRAGDFDFYVLSLSWSPSFCAEEGDEANSQQCDASRPYGFIVHGLWPQYERGYPRDCYTGQRRVPDSIVSTMQDIMPSAGLVGHQWRMHGSCSGLSQSEYFRTIRDAWKKIEIPEQFQQFKYRSRISARGVEDAFIQANPDIGDDAISVSCGKRVLREVRICMTRDLQFRACRELERKSCRADRLDVPQPRAQ